MKKLLFFMIAATGLILVSCGSSSYPTSNPGSQYPYPRTQSSYPRNETVMIDRDGRVITSDGRVIGNARNLPSKSYGSRSGRGYSERNQQDRYANVPTVLRVDDRYARRDNMGRLYILDRSSHVYWKGSDGYYYLDSKYAQGNRDYRSGGRY